VRKLRQSHELDLEGIRQAKMLELSAVQDHGNYLETLRLASSNLQELRDGMSGNQERERQLEARERRLADQERRLKMDEETADEEKRRLMELVSTLELQLGRLSKDSAEENWQLRQRMSSLEAERKAFEREKEFHREHGQAQGQTGGFVWHSGGDGGGCAGPGIGTQDQTQCHQHTKNCEAEAVDIAGR